MKTSPPISLAQNDWQRLEFAIEVIGDLMAYKLHELKREQNIKNPSQQVVQELQAEIMALGKERNLCYHKDHQAQLIIKAYTEYAPALKTFRGIEKV